jgi:zinc protease
VFARSFGLAFFKKSKKVFIWFFLFISVVLCGITVTCATSGTGGKDAVPLESDPAIISGVLENGLSYRILQNKYPENRIALRLAVNIGSIVEADNERGLAHLVEHLAFNGSAHFAENELIRYFESIGMQFGPDVNAYTSFDETVYMLEIPADDPAILDTSLTIISDWAWGLTFDSAELEKERGVVLEEWRLGRGVSGRTWDALLPFLFPFSRYANRNPIGKTEVVANAPRDRIVKFYKKWYRPELMNLVIVGDADAALLEQSVKERLSSIPSEKKKTKRPEYKASPMKTKLSLLLSDPETPNTELYMGSLFPALKVRNSEDFKERITAELSQSAFNARLAEVIEENKFLLAAESFGFPVIRSADVWILTARPAESGFTEAFQAVLDEIDRFAQFGVSAGELEREKTKLRMRALDEWQNRDRRESPDLADYLAESALQNTPVLSPDMKYQLTLDTLSALTQSEANETIKKYYSGRGTRLVASTYPESSVPPQKEIGKIWKNYRNPEISAYQDAVDARPLFPAESAGLSGSAAAERLLAEGITEWTLSNGAKVVVCQTDFKKDYFLFSALSQGGLSVISDEEYPSAALAGFYAERSGLNGFTQAELAKKLPGVTAQITPAITDVSAVLNGSAASRDMEAFFQLLNLYFTAPYFRDSAWERAKAYIASNIEASKRYPQWAFHREMQKVIYRNSIRFNSSDPVYLQTMNKAESERQFRRFFKDAGNFTFIFTGDISLDEAKRFSERYLASLPGGGEKLSARNYYPPFPKGKPTVRVHKGIDPQSMVSVNFGGENPNIEEDVLTEQELISAMVSLVEIRLRERIREKLGASYGIGVYCEQENYPARRYNAGIEFGCEPDRAEELCALAIQELRSIRAETITQADLVKLREGFFRSRETALKTNEFWQNLLQQNYERGEESARYSDTETVLAAITPETISRLIQRYFNAENYVTGILLPE